MPVAPHDDPDDSLIHGTRMESVEEIQELARVRAANQRPTTKETDQADTQRYRPTRRPPVLMLCILDDGSSDDGEWHRIRGPKTVIGRTQGDITIPHDDMMSSKHAELTRQTDKAGQRWLLSDLGSTNGTYLRVTRALLKHGQEFLVGGHRFRFEEGAGQAETTALPTEPEETKGTRGWQRPEPSEVHPLLVELTPQGEGQRFLLKKSEQWLGRNARSCEVVLPDDSLLSPRHARLSRDAKGRWWVENAKSLNGTWLRITQMPLERAGQFQLGEQRFAVKIVT
jgi:pSer/pThr/pTyr-binding forkhead associated (FHA) protein